MLPVAYLPPASRYFKKLVEKLLKILNLEAIFKYMIELRLFR